MTPLRLLRELALPVLPLAVASLLATGCAQRISATPLDTAQALDALKTTLSAWQSGGQSESLKTGSPSIVAQDLDWQAGASLIEFSIAGPGESLDSNLKVPVTLTLKKPGGLVSTRSVHYLVTTSPAITVFRAFP
ncbi:MAG TPA: hypothetical protein VFT74_01690 [Isosphaeraceae bacterium]|nr:hypothetical protein [Isosphaeraceae bacterium]